LFFDNVLLHRPENAEERLLVVGNDFAFVEHADQIFDRRIEISKSAVVMPIPSWAVFLSLPVYLQGPPLASQI
jgi:hypothetical protein